MPNPALAIVPSPERQPLPKFAYTESSVLGGAMQQLDGVQERYVTGFADMAAACKYSINGEETTLDLLSDLDLSPVILALHGAYVASVIRGQPIRLRYGNPAEAISLEWEFDTQRTFLSSNGATGWIAMENLPRFNHHYARYLEVIDSMPELLRRLELIEVIDQSLGRRASKMTEEQLRQQMQDDSRLLSDTLRNDGFLLHGPEKEVKVHHRKASEIIAGLIAIKSDVIASTDYTESKLWGSPLHHGGGLAGVDKKENETLSAATLIRINRCFKPPIKFFVNQILEFYGCSDPTFDIVWQSPFEPDALAAAEAELSNARAAEIYIKWGVFTPQEIRARYKGGGDPSPFAVPEPETAPQGTPPAIIALTQGQGIAAAQPGHHDGAFDSMDLPTYLDTKYLTPSSGMAGSALRGMKMCESYPKKGVLGCSMGAKIQAREPLSLPQVRRLYLFFSRHEAARSKANWVVRGKPPTATRIAWMLRGGDEGYAWVKKARDMAIRAKQW